MITLKDYEKFAEYRLLILDTDKIFAQELRSHLHMFNIESDIKGIPAVKNFIKEINDYDLIIADIDALRKMNDYMIIINYLNCYNKIIFTTSIHDLNNSSFYLSFNHLIHKKNYTYLIEKILLFLKDIKNEDIL